MSEDENQDETETDSSLEELAREKLKQDLKKSKPDKKPTYEELERKLEERETQLATISIKAFEREVGELVASQPKEKANEILEYIGDSPERLRELQASIHAKELLEKPAENEGYDKLGYDSEGRERVPPTTKGGAAPPKPKKETVESLYDILTNPMATREEKAEANKKLDLLWQKALKNPRDKKQFEKHLRGED